MRGSQPFPNPGAGVSTFTFPKRNESWRLVTMRASFTPGAAGSQLAIHLLDGTGADIACFAGPATGGVVNQLYTFSSAAPDGIANSGVAAIAAGQLQIGIPDDLWVQPQWTLRLQSDPANGADVITGIIVQTEFYPPKKPLEPVPRTGQDTTP